MLNISDVVTSATNTCALPQVCHQLRLLLDDESSTANDVARVLATDPMLMAKLLRLANSAAFQLSQQIETVQKAVLVLGEDAIFSLVLAEAMNGAKNQFKSPLLDTEQIWLDSLYRGVLARNIAKCNKVRGTERFFVLGLMSRLSEMVVAAHFPDYYERYLKQKVLSLPWHAQRAELGFTFAKANGAICKMWGLPSKISDPLSVIFSLVNSNLSKDAKTLQLSIKLTFYFYENKSFPDLASLGPEFLLWKNGSDALEDMLQKSYTEAKNLQHVFL